MPVERCGNRWSGRGPHQYFCSFSAALPMGFTAILAYAEGLPVRHHPHSRFMIRISLITITICSALLSDNRIGYALPDSPTADVIKELTSWAGQSESARPRLADQEFAKTPLNKAQAKQASAILVKDFRNQLASQRKKEWAEKIIPHLPLNYDHYKLEVIDKEHRKIKSKNS